MSTEDLVVRLRVVGQSAFRSALNTSASSVRAIGQAAKYVTAAAGVAAAAALKIGFDFNKSMDQQRVGFTILLGSQKRALAYMMKIRRISLKSPVLDPETTGEAARTFIAYGINAKDALKYVKALGDMSAATGKNIQETMPRGAMAIGQIASKGKLSMEELNQLAESVGLSQKRIRKELGMTKAAFAATFQAGSQISAGKALPAILAAMQKQSGGAAKMLSKTTSGRLDQLKETFKMKMGQLTRGAYNAFGDLIHGLTKILKKFDPKAFLKQVTVMRNALKAGFTLGKGSQTAGYKGLAGVMVSIGAAARKAGPFLVKLGKGAFAAGKQLVEAFAPALPFFRNVLLPLLKGIAIGVAGSVVVAFKVFTTAVNVLSRALGWIGTKLKPLRGFFEGVGKVIGFVFGGPILKAIGIGGKLGVVLRFLGGFVKFISRGFVGMGAIAIVLGKKIADVADGPLKAIGKALEWVWGKVKVVIGWFGKLKDAISTAFSGGVGAVKGVFDQVVQFFRDRINNLIDIINGAIKGYNAIPLAPNIGLIGRVGESGGGGTGGTYNPSTDGTKPTSAGSDRASRGAAKGTPGAGANNRQSFGVNPYARPGQAPTWGGKSGALINLEVPVHVRRREIGRASASITAEDLARA